MVEWKTIKDLFDIRNGYTPSTKDDSFWTGGNIPWFKMEDIRENGSVLNDSNLHITEKAIKGKGLFKANSIILATSATIGEHALITIDHLSNQRFTNFYPKKEFEEFVNMKFIYYYMFIVDEWCKQHTHQGGFASVDVEGLYKLLIPMPALSEQNRIVGILDTFTASIDNLKEQIAQRRKQYEYYRDQLLDLEGKEGVEMKKLEDIVSNDCSLSYGIVQPGDDVYEGIPVVRPVDLINTFISRLGLKNTTKEISNSYKRTILRGKEILFCVRGTTGIMSLATQDLVGCNVTRGIVPISFDNEITKMFVYYQLKSSKLQKAIADKTNGTALKQINIKDLRQINLLIPPLSEQQRIVSVLDTFEASIQNLEAQLSQREKQYEYYRNKLLTFE